MATPELIQSWARSEAMLRVARAALPPEVVTAFAGELDQFEEFLAHNELGLALDCLLDIADDANCNGLLLTRLLQTVRENMGRL